MSERDEHHKKRVEEATKRKAAAFAAVFNTRDGEKVLEALEAEFDRDELRGGEPHSTYFNLGQRDVVVYIKQMLKYSERNNESN